MYGLVFMQDNIFLENKLLEVFCFIYFSCKFSASEFDSLISKLLFLRNGYYIKALWVVIWITVENLSLSGKTKLEFLILFSNLCE